ncbi:MAG: H-X9-DG-CTERM domain-containing protein [Verrucomicrobiota bacterium]|nr:H-X9-DG-CTERM domain-containing protein [Verrucomicrobiota bacterium]
MLLPALQKAKEQGNKIVCTGNLKQLGFANLLYAEDYDGVLISGYFPTYIGPYVGLKNTSDYTYGTYYCPSQDKDTCYSWGNASDPYSIKGSYGYNYEYLCDKSIAGNCQGPQRLGSLKAPTHLLMWADSWVTATPADSYVLISRNSSMARTVSLRHNLGSNAVFADGSVHWYKQTEITRPSWDGTIARKYWGYLEVE